MRRLRPPADGERLDRAPAARGGKREVTLNFEREAIAVSQLCEIGAGVEVLAPEPLRQRLAALAASLRALYGGPGREGPGRRAR